MSERTEVAQKVLEHAMTLVAVRSAQVHRLRYQKVVAEIHVKQTAESEHDLAAALAPMFERQLRVARRRLVNLARTEDAESQSTLSPAELAEQIAEHLVVPQEWDAELVNRALPPMVRGMRQALAAQMLLMGRQIQRRTAEPAGWKATTASEWLESQGMAPGLADLSEEQAEAISDALREVFRQPFWRKINRTTREDIRAILERGLIRGWSINRIARRINREFRRNYGMRRATLVARTESAGILNAAREIAFRDIKRDMGREGALMRKVWISVLGDTTRPEHAALHDVPSNRIGNFNLDGHRIPYPAHWKLPAEHRCNCLCTIITEFDITPEEAQERIDAYNERIDGQQRPNAPATLVAPGEDVGEFSPTAEEGLAALIAENEQLEKIRQKVLSTKGIDEIDERIRKSLLEVDEIRMYVEDAVYGHTQAVEAGEPVEKWVKEIADMERKFAKAAEKYGKLLDQRNRKILRALRLRSDSRIAVNPIIDRLPSDMQVKAQKASEFIAALVNKEVATGSEDILFKSLPPDGRAFYDHFIFRPEISISPGDETSVYVHELGHWIESKVGSDYSRRFLDMRIERSGTSDVRLVDAIPEAEYDLDETGNPDDFKHAFGNQAAYVGKRYDDGQTEVMAMGFEALYRNPVGFAKRDPEYFKWLIGVVRGAFEEDL